MPRFLYFSGNFYAKVPSSIILIKIQ